MIKINSKASFIILMIAAVLIAGMTAGYLLVPKGVTAIDVRDSHGPAGSELKVYLDCDDAIRCTIEPAQFADREVTYEVMDPSIATVDDSGVLTGVATGKTALQVEAVNFREKIDVAVLPSVTEIKGIGQDLALTEGDTAELNADIVVADKSIDKKEIPISYSSDKKNIAAIDKDGTITAVKEGDAKITITAGGFTKTVDVSVKAPVVYTPPVSRGSSAGWHSGSGSSSGGNSGGGSSSDSGDSGGEWE